MPDKIVNHFVLADGSVARYDYDGLLNTPNVDVYVEKDGFAQVDEKNTTFFEIGNNRYNYNAVEIGKSIDSNGDIYDATGFFLSDYCYVGDLASFKINRYVNSVVALQNVYVQLYDQNKNKIGTRLFTNEVSNNTATYARLAYNAGKEQEIMLLPFSVTTTAYIDYGFTFKYAEPKVIESVTVGQDGDYTSILKALKYSEAKYIYVNAGTYNIVDEYTEEYGADFWSNYTGYTNTDTDHFLKGLWVKGRVLELSPNANIAFDYDGDNENIGIYFSIFAVSKGNNIKGGKLTLKNLTGQDHGMLRYFIHDDFENWIEGTNEYHNVVFDGNVRSSAPIGGGCGRQNRYVVDGCVFLNNNRPYDISYHNNSNDGVCFIDVHGCYGNSVLAFRWFGTGTSITNCIAHDNHFRKIECVAHTTTPSDIENMTLYAWNNETTE